MIQRFGSTTKHRAIDPVASMQAINHVVVDQVAQEIRSHLQKVIDEVCGRN